MRHFSFFSFALPLSLTLLLAACGGQVHLGDQDGGRDGGGTVDPDGGGGGGDGGGGEACGPTTCAAGTVCCNASCGICVEPGGTCTEMACTRSCTADAECGPAEYCSAATCGGPGTCVPVPSGDCPTIYAPVCGCDGATYANTCVAAAAGVNVASTGECSAGGRCAAQDARGVGDCPGILGLAWDGTRCDYVGGCGCEGADCGALFTDAASCESAYAGCAGCAAQDARGEGACRAIVGVAWDGSNCVELSGCSCAGADCDALYLDQAACQAAHALCGSVGVCGTWGAPPCPTGEYCYWEPEAGCGFDDGPGTCRPIPTEPRCPPGGLPVCGCDGNDYLSDCEANASGVSVQYYGSCGARACGGFRGDTCAPDEYCDWERRDICGAADALGTCVPRPTGCDAVVAPVCGCDGATYGNACQAHAAGIDDASDGPCG